MPQPVKQLVTAKANLAAAPHTWTKGLDYELIERFDSFILATDHGEVRYRNKVKTQVLENFERVK